MTLEELEIDDDDNLLEQSQVSENIENNENNDDINQDSDSSNLEEPKDNQEPEDLISLVLKAKGIDPNSIKFLNEAGEIEEQQFKDLTIEEQLELMQYNPNESNLGLELDEADFINLIRNNKMTVQDYLDAYGKHAIQDYLNGLDETEVTAVDSWTDDELFIADLKDKVPDLTDEEAEQQLNVEKQNESLFKKKIAGLRASYQEKERLMAEQEQRELAELQEKLAAAFEDLIVKTIQENDSIDFGDQQLSLSEDDMNEIASFILDSDAAGVRYIAKALNDPKMLTKMAWYALKGEEALSQIASYYKKKIAETGKTNYDKGFADGKSGKQSKAVVRKPQQTLREYKTIDELD